ncbi:hypothetical protein ACJMK2_020152, partial [Sinanodonta woodiana]
NELFTTLPNGSATELTLHNPAQWICNRINSSQPCPMYLQQNELFTTLPNASATE